MNKKVTETKHALCRNAYGVAGLLAIPGTIPVINSPKYCSTLFILFLVSKGDLVYFLMNNPTSVPQIIPARIM